MISSFHLQPPAQPLFHLFALKHFLILYFFSFIFVDVCSREYHKAFKLLCLKAVKRIMSYGTHEEAFSYTRCEIIMHIFDAPMNRIMDKGKHPPAIEEWRPGPTGDQDDAHRIPKQLQNYSQHHLPLMMVVEQPAQPVYEDSVASVVL